MEFEKIQNALYKVEPGYIARDNLDFIPEISGCGVFEYNETLVLTNPNQKN